MLWKSCVLKQEFSVRLAKWQYKCFRWQLRKIDTGRIDSSAELAKDMYILEKMMQLSIVKKDDELAYQTVELMKKFFGEQTVQPDYSGRMLRLCSIAISAKRYRAAAILVDAYKPLIKQLDEESCSQALDEFIILIDLSKKAGQAYIMDKIAKCVFACSNKIVLSGYTSAIHAIKDIGLNTIKSGDICLLKSAGQALEALAKPQSIEQANALHLLLRVWLHQILKRDDLLAFEQYRTMVFTLRDTAKLSDNFVESIIDEADNVAVMVGAHVHMRCQQDFVSFLVEISKNSVNYLRKMSYCIGKMAKMAISLHGLSAGFVIISPLLEQGKTYLQSELRFMNSLDSLRRRYLFAIIRENILLIEYIAKQSGGLNEIDIILSLRKYWQDKYEREENRRLVEQFCQLLLRQLLKDRNRLRKRLCQYSKNLLDKPLFDLLQTKKLGLESSS